MKNQSQKLNQKLCDLVTKEMKSNLISLLKENGNFIQTKSFSESSGEWCGDTIYGYHYDEYDTLVEKQVLAVALADDEIMVYLSNEDVEVSSYDNDDEHWYSIFGGDILGWFTMMNINEVIDQYI